MGNERQVSKDSAMLGVPVPRTAFLEVREMAFEHLQRCDPLTHLVEAPVAEGPSVNAFLGRPLPQLQ